MYAFYIYAQSDAPASFSSTQLASASVTFKDLKVRYHGVGRDSPSTYRGVQITLLPYRDFWSLVNPDRFCCDSDPVNAVNDRCSADQMVLNIPKDGAPQQAEKPEATHHEVDQFLDGRGGGVEERRRLTEDPQLHRLSVFTYTVEAFSQNNTEIAVERSGVYILMLSNCGMLDDAEISGSVIVRNPYGLLPGIEYYKMPLYVILSLTYACMTAAWGLFLFQWREDLFQVQKNMAAVLSLAFFESIVWYQFLRNWNASGVRSVPLLTIGILLSVLRSLTTYVILLVTSMGWGITRPRLGRCLTCKIVVFSIIYTGLHFTLEMLANYRKQMPSVFFFVGLAVTVLTFGMLASISRALWGVIRTLREQEQFDRLLLFQRLRCMLALCLAVAALGLVVQIVDVRRNIQTRWQHEWILTDAVPHFLVLSVHASMIYLWAPNKYSQTSTSRQSAIALLPMAGSREGVAPSIDVDDEGGVHIVSEGVRMLADIQLALVQHDAVPGDLEIS